VGLLCPFFLQGIEIAPKEAKVVGVIKRGNIMSTFDVVNFTNIDEEDYVGTWASKPTIIKSGETIQLPEFLAKHFSKHLANKILIREGKMFSDMALKQPLIDKMLGKVKVPAEIEIKEEVKQEVFEEAPKEPEPQVEPKPELEEYVAKPKKPKKAKKAEA
jgi:hypothetical protein